MQHILITVRIASGEGGLTGVQLNKKHFISLGREKVSDFSLSINSQYMRMKINLNA